MKRFVITVGCLFCLMLFIRPSFGNPVGNFIGVEGRVDITSEGEAARDAVIGAPIQEKDIIRTKSQSRAEIQFIDGSVMQLAEQTRIQVSSYMYQDDTTRGAFNLFRGKVRSLVSRTAAGLFGKEANKFEIRTRTAVVGVRATDFFTYYQGGVSGAVFREGQGYAYPLNRPEDVLTIAAGQALLLRSLEASPLIRAVSAMEIERHVNDTSVSGGDQQTSRDPAAVAAEAMMADSQSSHSLLASGSESRAAKREGMDYFGYFRDDLQMDERDIFKEFAFTIDISEYEGDDYFYAAAVGADGGLGVRIPGAPNMIVLNPNPTSPIPDPHSDLVSVWEMYIGNTPGQFWNGSAWGGAVFITPLVREDQYFNTESWNFSDLYVVGSYQPFNETEHDAWRLSLSYKESNTERHYEFNGHKWSAGQVEAQGVSAWVSWDECLTGVGAGDLKGTYTSDIGTWKAVGRWVSLETDRFLALLASDRESLAALNIPCVEVGRATLSGGGDNFTVSMSDVVFLSHATGGAPLIWATGRVSGTASGEPLLNTPVALAGQGLTADFTLRQWQNQRWSASVENGAGSLGSVGDISFKGGAAGAYETTGAFHGAGAGVVTK